MSARTVVIVVGCSGLSLAIGAALGRASAPARVVTVREADKSAAQLQEREARAAVVAETSDTRKRRQVERVSLTRPDGTRLERTREREVDEQHQVHAEQHQARRELQLQAMHERESLRVESTARSTWRAGALVGVQLRDVSLLPPRPGPLVYGAHVERRVAGPLWLGAWGLSSGTAGVSLSAEF